jgi:hypothetical protein
VIRNVELMTEAIKVLEPSLRSKGKSLNFEVLNNALATGELNVVLSNDSVSTNKAVDQFADRLTHALTQDSRDDNDQEIKNWQSREHPNLNQNSRLSPQTTPTANGQPPMSSDSALKAANITPENWKSGPTTKTSTSEENGIGSAIKKIL